MKIPPIIPKLHLAAALLLVAMGATTSHAAINVTIGGTDPGGGYGLESSVIGATTIDFNDVVLASQGATYTSGIASFSGLTPGLDGSIVIGNSPSQYAAPVGDTTNYLSVGGGRSTSVTVDFASGISYFGLYWGTADPYNSMTFYAQDLTTVIATIVPGTTPGVSVGTSSVYYNFTLASGDAPIGRIVFASSSAAFESDNFAYVAVPEPSALLFLGAAGLMFVISRRSSKQA